MRYQKLKEDLEELSKYSTKQVMIPISDVAFFTNGWLKHTNEVTVHLGDGYFV